MDRQSLESPKTQLKSEESEESIIDLVCTFFPESANQSANDDPSSCFK